MFKNRFQVTLCHSCEGRSDVSASAGNADFSLTAIECLLMLEAHGKRGVSNTSLPETQCLDTDNIKECLHKLKGMGLLENLYGDENKNNDSVLTARGEKIISRIRATWKVLMGQPSVSVADIQAALNILALMDPQNSSKTAH